jgi:CheY-like chemotaxis protein
MVLLISGQTQQGQRFTRVLEGHAGNTTVRVVSRAPQLINAVRAHPPDLIILDLTTPCEITPAFVITTFFPLAHQSSPLLIFTPPHTREQYLHLGQLPQVHVLPFPPNDILLRAIIQEYLPE